MVRTIRVRVHSFHADELRGLHATESDFTAVIIGVASFRSGEACAISIGPGTGELVRRDGDGQRGVDLERGFSTDSTRAGDSTDVEAFNGVRRSRSKLHGEGIDGTSSGTDDGLGHIISHSTERACNNGNRGSRNASAHAERIKTTSQSHVLGGDFLERTLERARFRKRDRHIFQRREAGSQLPVFDVRSHLGISHCAHRVRRKQTAIRVTDVCGGSTDADLSEAQCDGGNISCDRSSSHLILLDLIFRDRNVHQHVFMTTTCMPTFQLQRTMNEQIDRWFFATRTLTKHKVPDSVWVSAYNGFPALLASNDYCTHKVPLQANTSWVGQTLVSSESENSFIGVILANHIVEV